MVKTFLCGLLCSGVTLLCMDSQQEEIIIEIDDTQIRAIIRDELNQIEHQKQHEAEINRLETKEKLKFFRS